MRSSDSSTQVLALFLIDSESDQPIFRQLHRAVVTAIAAGQLQPGHKLPTVRALAAHLGLATNTVAQGYRLLESDGVVIGKGRAGTFVADESDPVAAAARQVVSNAIAQLSQLGMNRTEIQQLVDDSLRTVQ